MESVVVISIFILILFLIFALGFASVVGLFAWYRSRSNFEEAYKNAGDLCFFKIQVPEDTEVEVKAFEQFYTNLLGIKDSGRFSKNKSPHISLEIVGDESGINFYIVANKKQQSLVEKAVHAVYSDAEITVHPSNAWNIWQNEGHQEFKELYLAKEDYLPIKTHDDLELDTLNSITSVMSKMEKGEAIAMQVLIRPAVGGWKEVGNSSANAMLNKKDKDGNPTTSDKDREKAELIKSKTKYEGFDTVVRIMAVAKEKEVAKSHLSNLQNAINTLNNPQGNKFTSKPIKNYPFINNKRQFIFAFIFRVFPFYHYEAPFVKKTLVKGHSVLTTHELTTLYHLPNKDVKTPGINWLRSKSNIAPSNLPTEGLYLGTSNFRGVKRKIFMKEDDRRRHMYVVGQTGTGKTELLKFLAIQDIKEGKGVCFMDPHGSAVKDIMKQIPKERVNDVIYFNPGDEEFPMGLNLLDVKTRREKDLVINSFIELLYKLYDPNRQGIVGPQLERAVRNAMLSIMEVVPGGTMIEVMRLVIDQNYQKEITEKVQDPVVKRYWTDEMANTQAFHRSEKTGYFVSKFDRFVTEMVMRNIIGQSKSAFDFGEIMDQKKILLVDLNKGVLGEENSKFLGLLLVPRILGAAFRRANSDKEFDDFYFYVDEFQNFSTPDFVTILSEARKYKLNLIVANQFLAQMSDEIKNAIFGNVGTLVSFRVGQDDGRYMSEQFAPKFSESDLINLQVGTTVMRLLVDGHPTVPFTMKTDWEAISSAVTNNDIAAQIKANSQQNYGKPAKQVEKEIVERNGPIEEPKKPASPFGGGMPGGFGNMPKFTPPSFTNPQAGTSTNKPFSSGQTPFSNNSKPNYSPSPFGGNTGFRPPTFGPTNNTQNRTTASTFGTKPGGFNLGQTPGGFERQDAKVYDKQGSNSQNPRDLNSNEGGAHKRGAISLADVTNGNNQTNYKSASNTFKNINKHPNIRPSVDPKVVDGKRPTNDTNNPKTNNEKTLSE